MLRYECPIHYNSRFNDASISNLHVPYILINGRGITVTRESGGWYRVSYCESGRVAATRCRIEKLNEVLDRIIYIYFED